MSLVTEVIYSMEGDGQTDQGIIFFFFLTGAALSKSDYAGGTTILVRTTTQG